MKINESKQARNKLTEIVNYLNEHLKLMADNGFDCEIDIHERIGIGSRQTVRFIIVKPLIDIDVLED